MARARRETDAALDEVSSALGHASTETTRRHYDHFVRRRYSDRLRTGLCGGANVVVLRPAADAVKRPT
jgi:integrase